MGDTNEHHARLRQLEPHLHAHVVGQAHLLPRVAAALIRGEMGLSAPNRPRGSFLFVGPTGTGKTELALCFSEFLFGSNHLQRFDLSEYQNQSSVEKLIGADRADRGLLGRALANRSRGTLLFDELEKAHPLVLDLFLQMLDPAQITFATGETQSLSGWYVIFTSNIGSAEATRMERSSLATIEQAVLRRVGQSLRPELVGRIHEKVVFARLSTDTQREICKLLVVRECARLRVLGHELDVAQEAIEFLVREGYDSHLGARPMRGTVEQHLQQAVVRALFAHGFARGRVVVSAQNQGLAIKGDSDVEH